MLRSATTPFEAIAHPVRCDLLDALRESPEPLSVTDLGVRCEVSRSTASRHLDILRAAGLVVARSAAPAIHHELDRGAFGAIDDECFEIVLRRPQLKSNLRQLARHACDAVLVPGKLQVEPAVDAGLVDDRLTDDVLQRRRDGTHRDFFHLHLADLKPGVRLPSFGALETRLAARAQHEDIKRSWL